MFYIHPSSVREVAVCLFPHVLKAPLHHGVRGESEEDSENAHQETDQLCVEGEKEEVVSQTEEQEGQRRGNKRKM